MCGVNEKRFSFEGGNTDNQLCAIVNGAIR